MCCDRGTDPGADMSHVVGMCTMHTKPRPVRANVFKSTQSRTPTVAAVALCQAETGCDKYFHGKHKARREVKKSGPNMAATRTLRASPLQVWRSHAQTLRLDLDQARTRPIVKVRDEQASRQAQPQTSAVGVVALFPGQQTTDAHRITTPTLSSMMCTRRDGHQPTVMSSELIRAACGMQHVDHVLHIVPEV